MPAAGLSKRGRTRHSREVAGLTHLAKGTATDCDTTDYVAMLWAGQQANPRRLTQKGLATRANRLCIRYGGADDTLRAIADIRKNLPDADVSAELYRGRARADALLDEHWDTVVHTARRIAREGRVSFDGLESIAELAPTRKSRTHVVWQHGTPIHEPQTALTRKYSG